MNLKQLNQLMTENKLSQKDKNHYAVVGLRNGEVYDNVLLSQLTGMVLLCSVLWIAIYEK